MGEFPGVHGLGRLYSPGKASESQGNLRDRSLETGAGGRSLTNAPAPGGSNPQAQASFHSIQHCETLPVSTSSARC